MELQNIQELEALTPVEMDAGLVFSGVPTGNKIGDSRIPACIPPLSTHITAFMNRHGMPPFGS